MASRREEAGLPEYPELRWCIVETMRGMPMPAVRAEIIEGVADSLELTSSQRSVMAANGQLPEYADRVGWTMTILKSAGMLENVGRGIWSLSSVGESVTRESLERRISETRAEYNRDLRKRRLQEEAPVPEEEVLPGSTDHSTSSTTDEELQDPDWKQDLIGRLLSASPRAFEHLSRALLEAAGFADVTVTGGAGDGGIDGIGVYRPMGLVSFHTAFQCKRYRGSVGAAVVRDFRGSFIGRADRGIILTTGYFTRDAREEAARAGANPIDLIDGEALCDLLLQFEIGVKTRTIEVVEVDPSYFDQFEQD